jgi:hypothetical protein
MPLRGTERAKLIFALRGAARNDPHGFLADPIAEDRTPGE